MRPPPPVYGGNYGGQGVYVPGVSFVRVYLFQSCLAPSVASVWPGCWCALCYVDISPIGLPLQAQQLLLNYALSGQGVAARDITTGAPAASIDGGPGDRPLHLDAA